MGDMRVLIGIGAALAASVLMGGCGTPGDSGGSSPNAGTAAPSPLSDAATATALRMSPVPPPPPDPTNLYFEDEGAAELGRALFHTSALSKGGNMSCAKCHDPRDSFVDLKPLAEGVLPLERHTPSLWNVAHLRWFFWDGRADSLWGQALIPLEDPLEHAFARTEVARAIHGDPKLRTAYEDLFGPMAPFDNLDRFPPYGRPVPENDRAHQLAREHARRAAGGDPDAEPHHEHLGGSSGFYHPHQRSWDKMSPADQALVNRVFVNVGKCLAAFQRRMVSGRSEFDVFVEGLREGAPEKVAAMDPAAIRGFELFTGKAQCTVCHHGPLFTDYEFHDTRVPIANGAPADDPGRSRGLESLAAFQFGVTSEWSDDPDGPAGNKVKYLPKHRHAGAPEFKTPSLRNVALTPPYMHNGAFKTLEEVVQFYATREGERPSNIPGETILKPLGLSDAERADLVAFLRALTDDSLDLSLVRAPR